jgi:hypothetical protein
MKTIWRAIDWLIGHPVQGIATVADMDGIRTREVRCRRCGKVLLHRVRPERPGE